ncbi:hypothetical protein E2C01_051363 [Portunus trituberculatus]|uniref:Uncharacterized protein n=1 Tax=Portunus trituberculatus TaxID=210409 RepID=A0A5B7GLL6_PORTR|nr:hypothetical protein [Portunus trituberculatus]
MHRYLPQQAGLQAALHLHNFEHGKECSTWPPVQGGARCDFSYQQLSWDSVDACVLRCPALAAKCYFQCPECDRPLTEYMLCRKVVMGLSDCCMKVEVLWCSPLLDSVSDIMGQCEVIKATEKVQPGGANSGTGGHRNSPRSLTLTSNPNPTKMAVGSASRHHSTRNIPTNTSKKSSSAGDVATAAAMVAMGPQHTTPCARSASGGETSGATATPSNRVASHQLPTPS